MGGRRRPASFWLGLVSEWRASGQPLSRFAKAHGVAPNSLAHWVGRGAAPVRLLQVEGPEAVSPASGHVEMRVRGVFLRLSTDVPAAWLADVIRRVGDG